MSEHMKDEAECLTEMFAVTDAGRDALEARDLGTRLEQRAEELAEDNEWLRDSETRLVERVANLLRDLHAREIMVDVLVRRIDQMLEAPQPVAVMPDGRVIMNDGSVYVEVWARPEGWTGDEDDSVIVWQERDPLPRTRRAIAQEIATENASKEG